MKLTLPADSAVRKDVPLYSGCYSYFPAALAGVAMHSKAGNDKHNPGEPLHHARGKSMDHADCIARHSMDLADMLADFGRRAHVLSPTEKLAILTEARALSWRALAWHQELEERFGEAPLAPAARAATNKQDAISRAILDQRPEWEHPEQARAQRMAGQSTAAEARAYVGKALSSDLNQACDELVRSVTRSGSSGSAPPPAQCDQTRAQGRVSSHGQIREPQAGECSSGVAGRLV